MQERSITTTENTITEERHYTDFRTAVHWGGSSAIMCNNLPEVDPGIWDDIRGNFEEDQEVFQYFITDYSDETAEWMVKTFDLCLSYSSVLDCWILLVQHWGTSWDYVPCAVFSPEWWKVNGEKYGYKH